MDYLEQRALLGGGSRHALLGNALVLIAPRDSAVQLTIAPGFYLAGAPGGGPSRDRRSGLGTGGAIRTRGADEAWSLATGLREDRPQ
jgi:hypothetical protein